MSDTSRDDIMPGFHVPDDMPSPKEMLDGINRDTVTFPAPAFAHLLEHGTATTVEVMDPQPPAGTIDITNVNKGRLWCCYSSNEYLKCSQYEGETMRVGCVDGCATNGSSFRSREATVVSVAAKLVGKLTEHDWAMSGRVNPDTDKFPDGDTYVWVTGWEIKG